MGPRNLDVLMSISVLGLVWPTLFGTNMGSATICVVEFVSTLRAMVKHISRPAMVLESLGNLGSGLPSRTIDNFSHYVNNSSQ